MAHGPCGEQFREAFSCFVFSKEEPKGMDCIDNFKKMQDCFREHPDVYKGELEDDDEMDEEDRVDLQREVEERRALVDKVREREESERPPKRLLEEAPAPPRPAKSTSKQTKPVPAQAPPTPPATPPSSSTLPPGQKQTQPPPPPPSSEPHPGMSENHAAEQEKVETMNESAPSKTLTDRRPPPVQDRHSDPKAEVFDEDLALMPKAWHDGRDAAVPADKEKK